MPKKVAKPHTHALAQDYHNKSALELVARELHVIVTTSSKTIDLQTLDDLYGREMVIKDILNWRDCNGNTLLHNAAIYGKKEMEHQLREYGARADILNYGFVSADDIATESSTLQQKCSEKAVIFFQNIKLLNREELNQLELLYGKDTVHKYIINAQDSSTEDTLLHKAIYQLNTDVVKMLLAHGANPEVANGRNNKPVDFPNFIKGKVTDLMARLETCKEEQIMSLEIKLEANDKAKIAGFHGSKEKVRELKRGLEEKHRDQIYKLSSKFGSDISDLSTLRYSIIDGDTDSISNAITVSIKLRQIETKHKSALDETTQRAKAAAEATEEATEEAKIVSQKAAEKAAEEAKKSFATKTKATIEQPVEKKLTEPAEVEVEPSPASVAEPSGTSKLDREASTKHSHKRQPSSVTSINLEQMSKKTEEKAAPAPLEASHVKKKAAEEVVVKCNVAPTKPTKTKAEKQEAFLKKLQDYIDSFHYRFTSAHIDIASCAAQEGLDKKSAIETLKSSNLMSIAVAKNNSLFAFNMIKYVADLGCDVSPESFIDQIKNLLSNVPKKGLEKYVLDRFPGSIDSLKKAVQGLLFYEKTLKGHITLAGHTPEPFILKAPASSVAKASKVPEQPPKETVVATKATPQKSQAEREQEFTQKILDQIEQCKDFDVDFEKRAGKSDLDAQNVEKIFNGSKKLLQQAINAKCYKLAFSMIEYINHEAADRKDSLLTESITVFKNMVGETIAKKAQETLDKIKTTHPDKTIKDTMIALFEHMNQTAGFFDSAPSVSSQKAAPAKIDTPKTPTKEDDDDPLTKEIEKLNAQSSIHASVPKPAVDLEKAQICRKDMMHGIKCSKGYSDIPHLISKYGNENVLLAFNSTQLDGKTILRHALDNQRYGTAEHYIKYGADPTIKSSDGKAPNDFIEDSRTILATTLTRTDLSPNVRTKLEDGLNHIKTSTLTSATQAMRYCKAAMESITKEQAAAQTSDSHVASAQHHQDMSTMGPSDHVFGEE